MSQGALLVCVVVQTDCGPIASVYIGGYTSSIEESCEVAARKVVYDLMKKYEIVVEDVTYLRKQMYDRCGQLFWFKNEELERIKKEEHKVCMYEDLSFEAQNKHKKIVVDFVIVLRAIFRTVEIRCTPIETIEHGPFSHLLFLPRSSYYNTYMLIHLLLLMMDLVREMKFRCVACERNEVSATYRATITFTATDGTGALQLTTFTENSVPLLGMSAADIYHMKAMDDTTKFSQIANRLRSIYFLLKIGPTTALEQNKVLQWGIKGVEMEDTITVDDAGNTSVPVPTGNKSTIALVPI
uniref:Replication factor A C-terminal domain-containing protein n=1 Tax=Chenopodium quinoa TaxID=63459 RepID=A0A803N2V7_CHEQI